MRWKENMGFESESCVLVLCHLLCDLRQVTVPLWVSVFSSVK